MPKKRMAVEFGLGTDLRGQDYTKAAIRALKDALWHNSLTMAQAFGFPPEAMIVHIRIGVQQPDQVDKSAVAAILPYGTAEVETAFGGMDITSPDGNTTITANAAAIVYFDIEEGVAGR